MKKTTSIAIIPARGGSKRIPQKNIRNFCGKPIIAYSIEKALYSKLFDQVIVSTDCEDIATVAEQYGATVPFMRPDTLANDFTSTNAVIIHAIKELNKQGTVFDYVCCIYATAPFLRIGDLHKGFELLSKKMQTQFTFSATTFPFPIQRALYLDENNNVNMFQPEHMMTRSQDLIEAYHDAGQFYWGKPEAFLEEKPLFDKHSKTVILPRYLVQDIDTEEDWLRAELMYKALQ